MRICLVKVETCILHGSVPDDGGCSRRQYPPNVRFGACRQAEQTEENFPELSIFPAVNDNVDGGVEHKEEMVKESEKLAPLKVIRKSSCYAECCFALVLLLCTGLLNFLVKVGLP